MYAIKTNVGSDRKVLVGTLTNLLGHKPNYKGAPTFAYDFGVCEIDRQGTITFAPSLKEEAVGGFAKLLTDQGFICKIEAIQPTNSSEIKEPEPEPMPDIHAEAFAFTVRIPRHRFDSAEAFERFAALVASKRQLICKALGADSLEIAEDGDDIILPWFNANATEDERKAYESFCEKLVELSNQLKRVSATEKEHDNAKYQFRCFLLRLGFIGDEYKSARKILLRNLDGNSAFRSGSAPCKA